MLYFVNGDCVYWKAKGINPVKFSYIFAMIFSMGQGDGSSVFKVRQQAIPIKDRRTVPLSPKGRASMQVKERVTGLLSLPKEIALNLPLIMATGRDEINIENYKNLVEFTDTKIRINTAAGVLTVEGTGLTLKQVTTEHVLVAGKISALLW